MITSYRIAQKKYIRDLSGYGAYLAGGRWNLPGTYVLYLAAHRSLAYLEYLVHQYERELWPRNLMIATIKITDENQIIDIRPEQLPVNWASMQYRVEVQQTCEKHFKENILGLRVPSVVVPGEFNYVLNPLFKDFSSYVEIAGVELADFDERLKRPTTTSI